MNMHPIGLIYCFQDRGLSDLILLSDVTFGSSALHFMRLILHQNLYYSYRYILKHCPTLGADYLYAPLQVTKRKNAIGNNPGNDEINWAVSREYHRTVFWTTTDAVWAIRRMSHRIKLGSASITLLRVRPTPTEWESLPSFGRCGQWWVQRTETSGALLWGKSRHYINLPCLNEKADTRASA